MKLKKIHVFLILVAVLLFCCTGFSVFEGMANKATAFDKIQKATKLEKYETTKQESVKFQNRKQLNNLTEGQKNRFRDSIQQNNLRAIPKSQIPEGDEDLYVLKSQIVPPVCPKCPDVKKCDTTKACPPCPAPKRCPEKPFECKMVPKWSDPRVSSHLPRPRLASFDTFA